MCGLAVCDECDNDAEMHHACPDHADVPVIQGWAQIYTTSDTVEADLIRENLQSEGVDAEVLSQKDRSFNVDLGDLSPVRILVPAYDYSTPSASSAATWTAAARSSSPAPRAANPTTTMTRRVAPVVQPCRLRPPDAAPPPGAGH
jgi:hypothetical protein